MDKLGVFSGKEHRGSVLPLQQPPGNWPHLVPWLGTAVPGFYLLDNKGFASSLKEAICQWSCSWFLCLLPGGDISPSIFLLRSRKCFPSELSVFPVPQEYFALCNKFLKH